MNRNLHVHRTTGRTVVEGQERSRRRWYAVLMLGLVLHGLAMVNSDLGLDAHVRLNAAEDERNDGQDLAWDKLRIPADTLQDPTSQHTYEGYIPLSYSSPMAIKLTSFFGILCTAALAGLMPKWREEGFHFDPMFASIVLLSPVFLFVSGRGYDEGILACFVGLGVSGFLFNQAERERECFLTVVLMATSLLLLLGWKGFDMVVCLGVWAGVLVIGSLWIFADQRGSEATKSITQHPWKMSAIAAGGLYAGVFVLGLFSEVGTFRVIGDHPLAFAGASLVALIHVLGVFFLIGFFLWPFILTRWRAIVALRGRGPTMLAVYSAALLAGIITYIAALWTLESDLWNRSLFETMLVLGNNGRYATAVLIPVFMLIKWSPTNDVSEPSESSRLRIGIIALIPLILFVSLYGQQLWSQDAGEWLAESWDEEDSCMVMIAPETLAMHHLYVLKTHLDLSGEKAIDGYWRTSEQAPAFLEEHPECHDVLVVAPGMAFTPSSSQWELANEHPTPFTLSGGLSEDAWRVYRASP